MDTIDDCGDCSDYGSGGSGSSDFGGSFFGSTRKVLRSVSKPKSCTYCHGTGRVDDSFIFPFPPIPILRTAKCRHCENGVAK